MGLQQAQETKQVDNFINSLLGTTKALEDRLAQLESHEGVRSAFIAIIQDQKAAGTSGGTFTSGAWQTRTLNTEVTDVNNIASLASNQITLLPGTYLIQGSTPAFAVNRHQCRLQNITAGATIALGSSAYSFDTSAHVTASLLWAFLVITVPTVLELQHRCETTRAADGFGIPVNFETNVYAQLMIWKIS